MSDNPLDNLPRAGCASDAKGNPGFTPRPTWEERQTEKQGRRDQREAFKRNVAKAATKPERVRVPINEADRVKVFERDGGACLLCGRSPALHGVSLQCDHVIPHCQDGPNDESNYATLCEECNRGKSGRRSYLLELIRLRHIERREGKPEPVQAIVVDEPAPPKPERSPEDLRLLEEKNAQTEALIKKVQKPKGDKT